MLVLSDLVSAAEATCIVPPVLAPLSPVQPLVSPGWYWITPWTDLRVETIALLLLLHFTSPSALLLTAKPESWLLWL